jgi:hypothetical protein
MAAFSMTDCGIYVDGVDLTGVSNNVTLNAEGEDLDVTTFASGGWRERMGGLKTVNADVAGFHDANTVDADTFNALGGTARPHSIGPTRTEGDPVYLFRAGEFNYEQFGEVGAATPFSFSSMGTNGEGLIRGVRLKSKGNVNATGATGTGVQIVGGVPSGQYLYGIFHVFSAGTTITGVIESDDANTFASATTRITFGPVTVAGGTWGVRVAGAIADDWYRLRITAVTGTFSIASAVGIGA